MGDSPKRKGIFQLTYPNIRSSKLFLCYNFAEQQHKNNLEFGRS